MFKRIDAFDINFVDSAASKDFKLKDSTGMGEKRIYIGHDEERYDEFFDFENVEYIFSYKSDLLKYLDEAKEEFFNPIQEYKENLSELYSKKLNETNEILEEVIKYGFKKTYDAQNRYYLVLDVEKDPTYNQNYNYIRNISVPRVTKFCFIKLIDDRNGKKYIYMRPIYFNRVSGKEEVLENIIDEGAEQAVVEAKKKGRLKQQEYRQKLIMEMPACIFTSVTDDRILQACHIKPHRVCSDNEKYDYKNGITMTPTYHVLFDLGFISFKDSGELMVSPFLTNRNRQLLNLKNGKIYRLQNGSEEYLRYHRENIFCNANMIDLNEDCSEVEFMVAEEIEGY